MSGNNYRNGGNKFNRNNRNNRGGRGGRGFGFNRHGKRNNGNRNFDQRNNQVKQKEQVAPIEYVPRKTEDKDTKDAGSFTFIIPIAEGEKLKRKMNIFRSGTDEEFLQHMEDIRTIITDYPLTTDAAHLANTVSQIKECFAGPARADYIQAMPAGAAADEETLAEGLWAFTEEVLPENAAEEQATYLRTTKKPMKLSSKDWIKRINIINNHMGLMSEDATPF